MGYYTERGYQMDSRDLDNYITGHYGEDQYKWNEEEPTDCDLCGKEFTEANPSVEMWTPDEVEDAANFTCHIDCGKKRGLVTDFSS